MMSFKKTDGSFVARCDRRRNCDAVELALSSAGMRRVQASGRLTMMPTNAAMQSRRKCQPERPRVDRLRRKRGAVSEARLVRRSKAPDARGFGFSRQGGVCLPLDSTRTLNRLESQRSGRRGEARHGGRSVLPGLTVCLSALSQAQQRTAPDAQETQRTHAARQQVRTTEQTYGRLQAPASATTRTAVRPRRGRGATGDGRRTRRWRRDDDDNAAEWMDGWMFVCMREGRQCERRGGRGESAGR